MKGSIEKSLKIALVLTFLFFIVETVGGIASGSLSLLGDAGHMLRDVLGLFISLTAIKMAEKLPTEVRTFGYHRAEILAALINGFLLIGISGWIFWEAYRRFFIPREIEGGTMFTVALLGLAVNLYVASKLHGSHDLNVRSAFLHVLTDTFSSVAVLFASVWIIFTQQTIIDPLVGIAIAVFILFSSIAIIKDSLWILLEFAPNDVDFNAVITEMENIKGVDGVHNIHLWSLCSNINAIDAHILTPENDLCKLEEIKGEIKKRLEKYNIKHATFEFEPEECAGNERIKKITH